MWMVRRNELQSVEGYDREIGLLYLRFYVKEKRWDYAKLYVNSFFIYRLFLLQKIEDYRGWK